jgi:hypothetical protein
LFLPEFFVVVALVAYEWVGFCPIIAPKTTKPARLVPADTPPLTAGTGKG